jgi:hypothetical protein
MYLNNCFEIIVFRPKLIKGFTYLKFHLMYLFVNKKYEVRNQIIETLDFLIHVFLFLGFKLSSS